MSDFAPGDLVVCVDDKNSLRGHVSADYLRRGRIYTVETMVAPGRWAGGLYGPGVVLLETKHPRNPLGEFAANRFRKIDKADEGFSTWMKALRPVKAPTRERART